MKIKRLGIHGEGVGQEEGYTLFVDGALPEEEVLIGPIKRHKNYGTAPLLEILKPSDHRVEPPCPVFGSCGGCQLMHLAYPQQLEFKRQRVVDALERIGKLSGIEVFPCHPSPMPLGYRNKIQLPLGPNYRLGLYAKNSHRLVEIEKCYIHSDLGEKAFGKIQTLLLHHRPQHLRHVLIKTAVRTQQVLVILVTSQKEGFAALAEEILKAMPEIKGVVQNLNQTAGNVILSDNFSLLAGQASIEDEILGLKFKVSPASFFQVNPWQADHLYQKVEELADLKGKEVVLDAFCGVGPLSLILAKKAGQVMGVESVAQAISDARENAQRNGILNTSFHCSFVEDFIPKLGSVDIAVLNPPRKGCEASFLETLASLKPTKILYVSCDPATLARDLNLLHQKGYKTVAAYPFDMFPQTAHVETIAHMTLL